LAALITLGIKAFYPEPLYPAYPQAPMPYPLQNCAVGDAHCQTQVQENYQAQQDAYQKQEQAYQDQMNIYGRNLFIVANIIGVIVFTFGFWLLFAMTVAARSVPIGIMAAGFWSIIYGYIRGWEGANDQLKFFVGLVIAALVIGGSIWLIERYAKKTDFSS
jgi:uncharacterized membrane protein